METELLEDWLAGRTFDEVKAEFDARGYVIFPEIMSRDEIDGVRSALEPHLTKTGRNNFEGYHSNRVYALLAKAPEVFGPMAMHPLALAFAEADLGSSCLLSAMLAINLHPGETVQGWHSDDGHLQIPRPRPAYGISTFWSIDDTTEENGATEIIPGSHLWSDDQSITPLKDTITFEGDIDPTSDPQPRQDAVKAVMPAGSLMIAKGTLWHRGGANRSSASRLIVTPQYCPGWARPLETMLLSVPQETAAALPKRVKELIGYSIHPPFMGYVDGVHPIRSLD
ncbi:MAG: phytanoyl-CoA dioxygenase family protein [Pseudomonadota bacterium]